VEVDWKGSRLKYEERVKREKSQKLEAVDEREEAQRGERLEFLKHIMCACVSIMFILKLLPPSAEI
jgi:hypothetical protein